MATDNAGTVRAAIEKMDSHLVAGLAKLIPVRALAGGGGSASGDITGGVLGSVQNLLGGLGKIVPQLGQMVNLFKPIVSAVWDLVKMAMPSLVGAGAGAVAGAAGAGGAAAGAIGGAAGGAAAGGIGAGIAALASNPVGWAVALVAAATLVTAAFLALPSATAKFLDSLLESNRQLGEVSGSMAAVLAKSDFRNIMRDIRRGEALAPTASHLADALGNLKDSTFDLEVTFMKIINSFGTIMAGFAEQVAGAIKMIWGAATLRPGLAKEGWGDVKQGMTDMGVGISDLIKVVRGIDNKMPEKEGPLPMADFLNSAANWARDADARNDPAFRRIALERR